MDNNKTAGRKGNEPLHIDELHPGSVCSLIIAVFASAEDSSQESASKIKVDFGTGYLNVYSQKEADLAKQIIDLLISESLTIQEIEKPADPDRFSLLIYADCPVSDNLDLASLRQTLNEESRKLNISMKMQRSELFFYMHRI